jgi:hydroxymethylpyrimidine/phosphomethylpyrimidine kinase
MAGMEFTTQAWEAVAGWRDAVETMPFIRSLADGSLPPDAFAFYLAQDAAYLVEFSRVLSAASLMAPDTTAQAFYANSARVALEVETALHRDWLASNRPSAADAEPSPVTTAYTNHLLAACLGGSYPVVVAAVLPCYWLYAHVAEVLLRRAGDLTGHPYARWISTYADPGFQESARVARLLTDEAARGADPGTRARMLAAFERSSLHEYLFFDQGVSQPRWPTPPAAASS